MPPSRVAPAARHLRIALRAEDLSPAGRHLGPSSAKSMPPVHTILFPPFSASAGREVSIEAI